MLQSLGDGEGRCGRELGWVLLGVAPAEDLRDGFETVFLDGGLRGKDDSGGAIGEGRGIGRGDSAVGGLEGRLKGASLGFVELEDRWSVMEISNQIQISDRARNWK